MYASRETLLWNFISIKKNYPFIGIEMPIWFNLNFGINTLCADISPSTIAPVIVFVVTFSTISTLYC